MLLGDTTKFKDYLTCTTALIFSPYLLNDRRY